MKKPILFNDPKYQPKKSDNGMYEYVLHDEGHIHGFFGKYFFLNNGYKFPISDLDYPNITYPYLENAYQASKFKDINIRKLFTSIHFIDAINLAYDFQSSVIPNWLNYKLEIMELLLINKFCNTVLTNKLVETDNKYLREDNHWHDHYWGFCNGNGENNLGKLQMKIRDSIIN